MSYVVISHTHEPDAGVYRVHVGIPVVHEVHVTDADGNYVYDEVHVEHPETGKPMYQSVPLGTAEPGEEQEMVDVPVTERIYRTEPAVVAHAWQEDFVFDADDKRWKGKTAEQVAAEQRTIIGEALAERQRLAEEAAAEEAKVKHLPGVGDAL